MIRVSLTASAALLAAQTAIAGGLDRTGLPIDIIFQQGNYAEFSFASTAPSLTGTDLLGNPVADVGDDFLNISGGIKFDLGESLSAALIAEEPYGSDVVYGGAPTATMLGGTVAKADTTSLTLLGRYKLNDRFSVHAGVRQQSLSGNVTLSGLAYGGLSGYKVALGPGNGTGYVVGGAFEIPKIAARVALTYNSKIDHNVPTTETVPGPLTSFVTGTTTVSSPESIRLDFQTGVNPKTLVFGSVRYAKWSQLIISPTFFDAAVDPATPGSSISDLEDTYTYTLGVGRKINDKLALSGALTYEPEGTDDLVSPLSPTNGMFAVSIGARYTTGPITISGGVRQTWLGNARPETGTPDTARAVFTDNSALSVGFKIGVHF